MNQWYILINDKSTGPLDINALPAYGLTPSSLVWREGMAQWMQASQVPELAPLLAGTQPQQPPYGYQQPPYGAPGYQQPYPSYGAPQGPVYYPDMQIGTKSKTTAGVLALLLGGLGVQYFYLDKVGGGFITILLSIVTCGTWSILTFIQGILMLCMSNEEFYRKYEASTSTFPLF